MLHWLVLVGCLVVQHFAKDVQMSRGNGESFYGFARCSTPRFAFTIGNFSMVLFNNYTMAVAGDSVGNLSDNGKYQWARIVR